MTISGTETTFADVAPLVANRGALESGRAEVVIAYATSEQSDPTQQGVRLDFRWVVAFRYTSFWAPDPAEAAGIGAAATTFALNVLDDSPWIGETAAHYSDPESWSPVFGDRRPEEVLRHFHIAFDDFGSYDMLAVDCVVRSFPLSRREPPPWDPDATLAERAAAQAEDEAALCLDALALTPIPPISSNPLNENSPRTMRE